MSDVGTGPLLRAPVEEPLGTHRLGSRGRTVVVTGVLCLLLATLVSVLPAPYAVYAPGPVTNVLGAVGGRRLITISGRASLPGEGHARHDHRRGLRRARAQGDAARGAAGLGVAQPCGAARRAGLPARADRAAGAVGEHPGDDRLADQRLGGRAARGGGDGARDGRRRRRRGRRPGGVGAEGRRRHPLGRRHRRVVQRRAAGRDHREARGVDAAAGPAPRRRRPRGEREHDGTGRPHGAGHRPRPALRPAVRRALRHPRRRRPQRRHDVRARHLRPADARRA
nr:hypothetical protein [Angustibacter aerolatus]